MTTCTYRTSDSDDACCCCLDAGHTTGHFLVGHHVPAQDKE